MKKVYLDNASTSLVNPRVLDVAKRFTDMLRDTNLSSYDVTRVQQNLLVTARQDVANFLGCDKEEIALVQCTSHALGILADRLPLKKGDNVLICDLEYQASTVCWKRRQVEVGFEIRQVKTNGGKFTVDDFRKYIDKNTKVILLASVQETNGFRADVKTIGKLAKEFGCYYIVDGIQEVGSLQVNVRDIGVDFYCAGGKKWLGNPYGMGFLYIKRDHLQTLKPSYYSYYDIKVPKQYTDYLAYLEDPRRHPFDDYLFADDASVFEVGPYGNYIGAMGLSEAIYVLNDFGMENIEKNNITLNKRLYNGLQKLGLCLESPGQEENMSSIVSFNFNHLKNNNVEKERRLIHYLQNRNIYVSLRCSTGVGGVRVSVHYYSTEEEVDTFLSAVKEFI